MPAQGWSLLFHGGIIQQLSGLAVVAERARRADPNGFKANANVKLFAALAHLIFDVIPSDPSRAEYRQCNTLGPQYRHWFRAKLFARFRLFFRYDSQSKIIIYAWVNDASSLRQAGGRRDPYLLFQRLLDAGRVPDRWDELLGAAAPLPAPVRRVFK